MCLARRAAPIFALLGGSDFFAADRELIDAVAGAIAMDEVRAAVDDYWDHPANRQWLRRVAGLRVSTLRLRQVASEYLPLENPSRVRRGRRPAR